MAGRTKILSENDIANEKAYDNHVIIRVLKYTGCFAFLVFAVAVLIFTIHLAYSDMEVRKKLVEIVIPQIPIVILAWAGLIGISKIKSN